MARWEPMARERLEEAAIQLFAERGCAAVTVPEIAERAGLTRASFFRYYPDKLEVLFCGQDTLVDLAREAVASAPAGTTACALIAAALDSISLAFERDRHSVFVSAEQIIESDPGLHERRAHKRAQIAASVTAALKQRGTPQAEALVAGQFAILAFSQAYTLWTTTSPDQELADLSREALSELIAASASLGSTPRQLRGLSENRCNAAQRG